MALSDTLGAERLASQYFLTRLGAVRQAQHLAASEQFDLARSPLSDDELEDIVDQFRDSPAARSGWGLSEGLEAVLSREPKSIPVADLKALQTNLIAQGYAAPDADATGIWDTSWYASFRRFDRDNFQNQREGRHWYSSPVSSGINALTNTLPSRVFQGIVGGAVGVVQQTPETFERAGAIGGAAIGAGIGAAAGSVVPGIGTAIGAAGGAVIGGVGGFLADLFGEDEGEPDDQGGLANFVDALSPWTEYNDNPKDIFKDLGYTLTAASYIAGAGVAARGVTTGVRTLQAARTSVPGIAGEAGALAPSVAPGITPIGAPSVIPGATPGFAAQTMPLAKAALMRPPGANQLGVFGTVVKAATRKLAPGSVGALEQTMLRYSGFTFGQRLGPNIALKAFGGLSQAAMGPRLFGGLGQGSREKTEEAKAALEAELGRSLSLEETRELETKTAQTAIEKALTAAPELRTGVELPLIGDMVDLAAFVLYPQRLLPFRGTQVAKSSVKLMGDTTLAPFAHALQHLNPGLGIRKAVSQVKGYLTPLDNAWMRADYGIDREAHTIVARAFRGNVEKAFRSNALPNARADIIRTIRTEFDRNGKSDLLERVVRYSMDTVDGLDGPTDFTAWLTRLNGKHRGLDRLASWKEANKLARRVERELNESRTLGDTSFSLREGQVVRAKRSSTTRSTREQPGTNIDRMVLKDRVALLNNRAKLYEQRAERGALDPFTSIQLREQARLARSEAQTLEKQLGAIRAATKDTLTDRVVITPARLDFADRSVLFAKREEFLRLRQDVLSTVESGNRAAEPIARKKLANFVDELAMDGHIPDQLATKAKIAKPSDRIAKYLETQAKSAAKPLDIDPQYVSRFEELGYKPVATGDDVLFPDQLEQMIEVTGIGDYTRRAQVWETLGLSPKWRSDRALFRLRREHELAELNDVFARTGVKMSGEQAMRRLYERLRAVNHDGAVLGPFVRSEGKTRLYKVDARDLSADDIFRAFEDVPGVTDEVAHEIFGALRRGAAYGGEAHLLAPMQTMKAIGNAMRLNGLPGFSDVIRTAHTNVPNTIKRGALRRGEYTYKPLANADANLDLAHSAERARVETGLKQVAAKANVTEGQRQMGMQLLDSLVTGQVKAGRFASVDDAYRHLGVEYAEKYLVAKPLKEGWAEELVKGVDNELARTQLAEDLVEGVTQFGPDLGFTMRFFRNADFSTLIHEDAHLLRRLLPEEDVKILEHAYGLRGKKWSRAAEERFAREVENYMLRKVDPGHSRGALTALREATGSLWGSSRGYVQETNAVPRSVRKLLDKTFEDVLTPLPGSRTKGAAKALGSKQAIGGAAIGGVMGATTGDEGFEDILKGVALGAAGGLATRSALRRTYGYLPDYLTRVNTALRYTLSFTFDAGRFSEQNMIAMTKHGLPPMLSPTKYIKARDWKTPFGGAKVSGDEAWQHAVRFWDELNGTSWFTNIDDLDRRLFQTGMLGFSPRNWEIAQAFQLYQRGMSSEKIREAISGIGRYGLGRNAAEKSANFVVFPFSFSKKLITTLGDFFLQAPARNLLLHESYRRFHESEFDDKVEDFLERHVPLLDQLKQINNLAYGISPGRFFLQGLSDHRTDVGKTMQILASFFVPSGAATPLAQAAGGVGDLAVHAFSPIVLTGESITRGGGMDPITEIFRRYVPFVRELDQYFLSDDAAVRSQLTALKEGAAPYYQFQKYQDELKEAKSGYEALAPVLGYSSLDGLLQSDVGAGIDATLDAKRQELSEKYPTGFRMSQTFSNSDAINERALLDISEKSSAGRASMAEEQILELAELEQSFDNLRTVIDPQMVDAMVAKTIREKAVAYASDREFAELYDRFYLYTYGPIRRVA